MFHENLKKVSVAAMEEATAKAINDLSGAKYTCDISDIDYEGRPGSFSAKFSISLSENLFASLPE